MAAAAPQLRTSTPLTVSAFSTGRICSRWLRSVRSTSTSRQSRPSVRISAVQRIVGGAAFLERAQRPAQAVLAFDHRRDDRRRRADLQALERDGAAVGQRQRNRQLFLHRQGQVLERAQRRRQAERARRVDRQRRRIGGVDADVRLELGLDGLEPAQILRHVLGARRLAVHAAARLAADVAREEPPALGRAVGLLEGDGDAILPGRDHALDDGVHLRDVDRVLEPALVEVEDEQGDHAHVGPGVERDRAEGLAQRPLQVLLDAVRVVQVRERHRHRLVALAGPRRHHDLGVARHVDHAVDERLERGGVGVEQLAARHVVEERARLAVGVRVLRGAAALEQPGQLLPHQRDVLRLGGERALGQAAEQQRRRLERAVGAPLADHDVVDRLEMVDGLGVGAVVDVDDALVGRGRAQVRALHLHQAGEDDGQQRRILEHAQRGGGVGVRLAVGPEGVALDAEHHVVVGHQPVEERPRRVGLLRSAAAIAQPRRQLGDAAAHGGEVLDAEEHRLQHREHLVLDAAQAVAGFDALDAELAVELARAVLLRAADPDHALPLAADAEDRMDRREDAEPFLLEVVLEALEDERRVGRVGLDDRHLVRRSLGARLGVVGVADGDVQPGQALVQLDGRRHRARDEAEDAGQPRRDHLGREPQRQGVRHVAVDDGREGEEQVAIGVRRGAADVIEDAGKRRDPALRVGGDHGPSDAPNPRRGCPLYPEHLASGAA